MHQSIHSVCGNSNAISFKNATGKMRFTLTNDYLFRATLQKSKKALKGLICAVLKLRPEEIYTIEIKNPIELGKSIEAKDFILDIRVLLNNQTNINLEMQVLNLGDWTERSLQYLCRSLDQLNVGQDYSDVKTVIQVCFLDFSLFDDQKEFFSTYMFMNVKNQRIYSDKLKLHVIDLTCIDIATKEDVSQGIDHWAHFFKATTWEEIQMLAANNSFIEEAAETVYRLSTEEQIRMQCEAREDFYKHQRYVQKKLDRLEDLEQALDEKKNALQKIKNELKEKDTELREKDNELKAKNTELAAKESELTAKESELAAKESEIVRLREALATEKNKDLQN